MREAYAVRMTLSRLLLIGLTLWGLAMIVPDLLRVVQPLGSFGLYANNDGLIYDANGPFNDDASSPAWRAGIRNGDRIDLAKMRCTLGEMKNAAARLPCSAASISRCQGQTVTLDLMANEGGRPGG